MRGRVGRLGPAMIAGSNKQNVTGKRPLKGAVTEKKSVIQKKERASSRQEYFPEGMTLKRS